MKCFAEVWLDFGDNEVVIMLLIFKNRFWFGVLYVANLGEPFKKLKNL